MSMLDAVADQRTAIPPHLAVASPRVWPFFSLLHRFRKRKKVYVRRKSHKKPFQSHPYARYYDALTVSAAVFSPWYKTHLADLQYSSDLAYTASESLTLADNVHRWSRIPYRSIKLLARNDSTRSRVWEASKYFHTHHWKLRRGLWRTAPRISCTAPVNQVNVTGQDNIPLPESDSCRPLNFASNSLTNEDLFCGENSSCALTEPSDSVNDVSAVTVLQNGVGYKKGNASGLSFKVPSETWMQPNLSTSHALEPLSERKLQVKQPRPKELSQPEHSTHPNFSESLNVNDTVIISRVLPKSVASRTLSFVPTTKHSLFRLAGKKHFRRPHLCEDTGFLAEFDIASQQKNESLLPTALSGGEHPRRELSAITAESKNKAALSVSDNSAKNNNQVCEKHPQTLKQHDSNEARTASGVVIKPWQPESQRQKSLTGEHLKHGVNPTRRHNRVQLAMIFDGHGPQVLSNTKNGTKLLDEAYISPGKLIAEHSMRSILEAVCIRLKELLAAPLLPSNHSLFLKKSRQAIFSETFNDAQRQLLRTLPPQTLWEAGTTGTIVLASSVQDREKNSQGLVEVMCCNMGDSRAVAITFKRQKFSVHSSDAKKTTLRGFPSQQNTQASGSTPSSSGPSLDYFVPESLFQLSTEENIRHLSEQRKVIERLLRAGYVPLPTPRQNASIPRRNRVLAAFVPRQFWPPESSLCPKQFSTLQDVKAFVESQVATWSARQTNPPPVHIFTAFCIVGSYVYRVFYNPHTDRITIKGLQLTASLGDRYLEPVKQASRDATNVSVTHLVNDKSRTTLVITASDGLWGAADRTDPSGFSLASFLAYHLTAAEAGNQKAKTASLAEILSMWAGKRISDDVTISVLVYPNMRVVNAAESQPRSSTAKP